MRAVLWMVLIALIVRGAVLAGRWEALFSDPDSYRVLAEAWAESGTFGYPDPQGTVRPTAFRPPGYPWLLSWAVTGGRLSAAAVALIHGIAGGLTVLATGSVALRVGASPWVAGLLVALDPILLIQSTQPMTEVTAALLAAVAWLIWIAVVRRENRSTGKALSRAEGGWLRSLAWSVGLAGVLLAAVLVRPTFVVWAAGLVLVLVGAGVRRRRLWLAAAVVTAVLAGGIGGWAWRNQRAIGHPVWATTHGGYTLLLAHNPMYYRYLRSGEWGRAWDAEPFFDRWSRRWGADPSEPRFWDPEVVPPRVAPPEGIGEWEEDRRAAAAAQGVISREPGMFLRSLVHGVVRLWSPLPLATRAGPGGAQRAAVGAWYVGVYALALWGLYRLGRRAGRPEWLAGWALVASLSVVHAVYWSNLRMRAPAVPVIAVLAAMAAGGREKSEPTADGLRRP